MTTQIHIDFETFSEADIRAVGAWAYSRHPSTEVICMAWAADDQAVQLETDPVRIGNIISAFIALASSNLGDELHAFNSFFEYSIIKNVLGIDPGPMENWHDTAARAAMHCLPPYLAGCCAALGLPDDLAKNKRGTFLINRLCKPYKGERVKDPELLAELYEYCKQDVVAERAVSRRLAPLGDKERAVWLLDQKINLRGVLFDKPMAENAIKIMDETVNDLTARVSEITNGELTKVSERQKVMDFIQARGFTLANFQKSYLESVAEQIQDPVSKELIEIRLQLGKTSCKKYNAVLNIIDDDDRARGMLRYHRASTGRWGGQLFQPQNLPRGSVKDMDTLCEAISTGNASLLRMLYGDPMEALSSGIRGCIVAPPGKQLIVADYSAIEARVLAWLAGQDDVLQVFKEGTDVYKHTASKIFKKPIDQISKDERFIGKTATLALGYQGGWQAFARMAEAYGVEVTEDRAEVIKNQWREANGRIVSYWYNINDAAIAAVKKPNTVYRVRNIAFMSDRRFLYCRLPSGRKLHYFKPEIRPNQFGSDSVHFLGNNSVTRNFDRQSTYGGKLVENITQAVARDLMAEAMIRLDDVGFYVVLSVHDELIAEARISGNTQSFSDIMRQVPAWASGLPVDVEQFECQRYRK